MVGSEVLRYLVTEVILIWSGCIALTHGLPSVMWLQYGIEDQLSDTEVLALLNKFP